MRQHDEYYVTSHSSLVLLRGFIDILQGECTPLCYHRTGFNCESLLITDCECFLGSQSIETQT